MYILPISVVWEDTINLYRKGKKSCATLIIPAVVVFCTHSTVYTFLSRAEVCRFVHINVVHFLPSLSQSPFLCTFPHV